MSKKNLLYEFDPVIYPRKLWVYIGSDEDYINRYFHENGSDKRLSFETNSEWDGLTLTEVVRNDTNMVGILVIFRNKADMRMGIVCHEASHAVDAIENIICMEHGGEPSAYLLEWVCKSINLARLGSCEPLKFQSESEK